MSLNQPSWKTIPDKPGVYYFEDGAGEVLYVGKAKNLRNRLRDYWSSDLSRKQSQLMEKAEDFQFVVGESEYEAFVLESNLIKKHRPPFNVVLRDDKNYLYVRIDMRDDFPDIELVRNLKRDGARYFGPFVNSNALKQSLKFLRRLYPYCGKNLPDREKLRKQEEPEPCLGYRLGLCEGACLGEVTPAEYKENLERIMDFLKGRREPAIELAREKMQEFAEQKRYEEAARFRDLIEHFKDLEQEQRALSIDERLNFDAVGWEQTSSKILAVIISVREGKVVDQQITTLESQMKIQEKELAGRILIDYYNQVPNPPEEIVLGVEPQDREFIEKMIKDQVGHSVTIMTPKSGVRKNVLKMAQENAKEHVERQESKLGGSSRQDILKQMQSEFDLPQLPERIEIYDVSHISGTDTTGAMVVFEDGLPNKNQYRKFKLKDVPPSDDYGALRRLLQRRLSHLGEERFGSDPDLIVIDGGPGQLSTALEIIETDKHISVPVLALAKKNEEIYLPEQREPITLPDNDPVGRLLRQMRDEAHRFAVTYHRKLRSEDTTSSFLEEVTGIGRKRKHKLLSHFGSLAKIKEASVDEISEVIKDQPTAEKLKKELEDENL